MTEFKCSAFKLKGKKCSNRSKRANTICCYYCKYINKCLEEWEKGEYHCRLATDGRWCSVVKDFLEAEKEELKVIFS